MMARAASPVRAAIGRAFGLLLRATNVARTRDEIEARIADAAWELTNYSEEELARFPEELERVMQMGNAAEKRLAEWRAG
jgi:hypothetical protein